MTRSAAIFQHVSFEDLGSFEHVLLDHGFQLTTYQLGVDDLARARVQEPDLLIVLGGPISVNDARRFPFLNEEQAVFSARLLADAPCIGICLGAQLMSLALGGQVLPMLHKEIGWTPLSLSHALASDDPLRAFDATTDVLHWHGEQFTIPEGAVPLASTPICANQAFAWRNNGLALQFHPEVTARGLERWYIGHVEELSAAGCDIVKLRAESRERTNALRERAQLFLDRWLRRRGL
jgi:GMP synthase (glutamine-hydrolysing)